MLDGSSPSDDSALTLAVERNELALEVSILISHAEIFDRIEQRIDGLLRRGLQNDAEQARRPGKIPSPDRMARIGFQRGVQYPDDLGPRPQPPRHLKRRSTMLRHPDRARAQSTQRQKHFLP